MRLPARTRSRQGPIRRIARAGRSRTVRRTAARVRWRPLAYLPVVYGLGHARRKLGIPRLISLVLVYGAPIAVARALPRGRGSAMAAWMAHMWSYKLTFETPFDQPDKLHRRLRVDQPIRADSAIAGGTPPSQWLQHRLRRPPRLSALDYAMTSIYLAWEPEPHLALAWILWRHPGRFPGAALRLAATFNATIAGYYLVPTAPPWWASEKQGRMNGDVHRVTLEVMRALRGKPRPEPDHESGANPWASMPSDHFASTISTAIALSEADPCAGAVGATYALALGLALVYTGEHYVIDLIAGAALALAVHGAATLASRPLTLIGEILLAPGPLHQRLRR